MYDLIEYKPKRAPWNKGKLVGQETPLKPQHIWGIRVHLQMANNTRGFALFNLAIDSKLRGCDLVKLRVSDISQAGRIQSRAQIRPIYRPGNMPVSWRGGCLVSDLIPATTVRILFVARRHQKSTRARRTSGLSSYSLAYQVGEHD